MDIRSDVDASPFSRSQLSLSLSLNLPLSFACPLKCGSLLHCICRVWLDREIWPPKLDSHRLAIRNGPLLGNVAALIFVAFIWVDWECPLFIIYFRYYMHQHGTNVPFESSPWYRANCLDAKVCSLLTIDETLSLNNSSYTSYSWMHVRSDTPMLNLFVDDFLEINSVSRHESGWIPGFSVSFYEVRGGWHR